MAYQLRHARFAMASCVWVTPRTSQMCRLAFELVGVYVPGCISNLTETFAVFPYIRKLQTTEHEWGARISEGRTCEESGSIVLQPAARTCTFALAAIDSKRSRGQCLLQAGSALTRGSPQHAAIGTRARTATRPTAPIHPRRCPERTVAMLRHGHAFEFDQRLVSQGDHFARANPEALHLSSN